jgi:hypothetical protein
MFFLRRKKSGSKEYAVVTADDPKGLALLAKRLKVPIHGKGGQEKHLDVKGHKIEVAMKWGAREDAPPDKD